MRIIDIRKFNKGFAVYVNMDYDIECLKSDKRFTNMTTYYKNKKLLGQEFYFTFMQGTCTQVKSNLVKLILGPARKEHKNVVTDIDLPMDYSDRCITKEHRKRQPKIVKSLLSNKTKGGKKNGRKKL
jgi:hypothetical protein